MKLTITNMFKTVIALGTLLSLISAPALALAADLPAQTGASAQADAPATVTTTAAPVVKTAAMTRTIARANQEIDRRTTKLNELIAKVSDIKNLIASDKASITTAITNQVNGLAQLKAKIDADDAATLKADVQSVTSSYRIYALVLPQVHIIVAADRVVTVAGEMQLLSAKLESRISAAQSAGADMTAAANVFADFNAKVSSAGTQAQAAVSEIAVLVPDGGDKTKMASNAAALKDARAKVVAAQKDLAAARKDAATIVAAVKGKPTTPVAAPATTTPSTQVQTQTAPAPTAGQ